MAVVVADTFTRADSTTVIGGPETGTAPVVVQGTWGIATNQGYVVTTVDGDILYYETNSGVHSIQADVSGVGTGGNGDYQGVHAQYSDSTHYYLVQLAIPPTANTIDLYSNNGGFALLATTGAGGATSATLLLTVQANSQTVSVNGTPTLSATDSAVPAGTKIGFRHGAGGGTMTPRWDNLIGDNLQAAAQVADAGPFYVASPPGFLSPIGTMTRFPMFIGDDYVYPGAPVSMDGGHGDMAIAATTDGLIGNMDLRGHGDIAIGGVTADLILTADLRGHGDLSVAAVADLLLTADLAGHGDIAIGSRGDLILTADLTGHADQAIAAAGSMVATLDLSGHGDMAITAAADLMYQAALEGHADIAIALYADLTVTTSTTTTVVFVFRRLTLGSRRMIAPRSHGIRGPD